MKKYLYILLSISLYLLFDSCQNNQTSNNIQEETKLSDLQKTMIQEGWELTESTLTSGELSSEYGIKPQYGIHDNYFDIEMGNGGSIALKLINLETNKCIRYIYVREASTITIHSVPQGKYYLKIAYGKDWMEKKEGTVLLGKFTNKCSFERSTDIFDFGRKNSKSTVNYTLKINVQDGTCTNNFNTIQITEEDFNN